MRLERRSSKVSIKTTRPSPKGLLFLCSLLPTLSRMIKLMGLIQHSWTWLQEEKWPKIEEEDCSNGRERAQEKIKTEPSWPFSSRCKAVLSQTIPCCLNENGLCGKGGHRKSLTTVWLNACWKATVIFGEGPLDRINKVRAFWSISPALHL